MIKTYEKLRQDIGSIGILPFYSQVIDLLKEISPIVYLDKPSADTAKKQGESWAGLVGMALILYSLKNL